VGVALTWGGSFLFIELGLDHFKPGLVAFLRVFFGAVTLAMIPGARRSLPRADWPLVALLGVIWMAVPFMLFSIAQQWIESSLAGMINAATPLFTTLVAAILVRHLPGRLQAAGLVIGFLGVVAVASPSFGEGESTSLGIVLVLLAAILYGFAFNIAGSLQRRHGALPVIWRAQLVAMVLLLPVGTVSATESTFAWESLLPMVALGSIGTALAFVWFTTLVGRVGASRGSVTLYFVPVVAIALGALLLDESIALAAVLGTALVLGGAYLTSREEPAKARPSA
jgi:drug/metabolite transporter (DMT)-like permease